MGFTYGWFNLPLLTNPDPQKNKALFRAEFYRWFVSLKAVLNLMNS